MPVTPRRPIFPSSSRPSSRSPNPRRNKRARGPAPRAAPCLPAARLSVRFLFSHSCRLLNTATQTLGTIRLAARPASLCSPSVMPLYAYAPLSSPCRLCGEGFEHRATPSSAELTACPTCGQSVHRAAPQPVNSPKLSAPLSVSRARQAGFTVLKRISGGEFEKQ